MRGNMHLNIYKRACYIYLIISYHNFHIPDNFTYYI